ncbi:MAG: SDR family NAD(P)-dependent oxidoreductase, partial [archaeon]|nr:SDR family NAD(P)-dependent oxidoreductase [archaeon]
MTKSVDKVLVTGGAGFIGSHTVDLLLEESYQVMILDALVPQVHGTSSRKPSYLNSQARFIQGDVRDRYLLKPIIKEVDAIIHL